MAMYRTIQLSFWTDEKVLDEFTPEDKYFYLYLFTNPQTNMCGCYELSWTQTSSQLGYSKESVIHLIERFENVHKVIKYSKSTKEILLLNWYKYNWQGGNQVTCISKEIDDIKDSEFRRIVTEKYNEKFNSDKPLISPLQATVTVTVNNTVTDYSLVINNIVSYLNNKLNTNYKSNTKNTVKHIKARLSEGFTEEDFYTVIDKKVKKWQKDPKMAEYLRPETLFGTKFESYLNEPDVAVDSKSTGNAYMDAISNRVNIVDTW